MRRRHRRRVTNAFRPLKGARNYLLLTYLVPIAVLAASLIGCASLIDSDAARVCRTLIPILDRQADQIDIVSTGLSGRTSAVEQAVTIDYLVTATGQARAVRRMSCLFAAQSAATTYDAALGVAGLLVTVVTDDGAIGPLRLRLLKQNWIARGGATSADPAPFATFGAVPVVPRWLASVVQNGVSALPIISIYAVLAAAYALVYGLVGRINLAFGELTILAGYGTFLGFTAFDGASGLTLGLLGAVAVAAYTALTQGAALGRWVLLPLSTRPGQHILIATIGLSLFWSELIRLTQGTQHRWMGPLFNRPLALMRNGDYVVTVTPMALILPTVATAAAFALVSIMNRSRFGRRWRAFADDPKAAALLGVDPQRLVLGTMLLASGCAAISGLLTTFYYGGVGFAGGQIVGLKALIAALIGGIGSVPGALLGGVILGLMETVWSAVFTIESRDPAVFLMLVLLLALRPEGVWRS